jgi:hypothetical protein
MFPPRRELISYNYDDIADGTGYVTYYGALANDGTPITTTTPTVNSEWIKSVIQQNVSTTLTQYFDYDFDITFNLPKNVKGDILVNVPLGIAAASASQLDFSFRAIVKAYHYDGSTETQLGSTATGILYDASGLQNDNADDERASAVALLTISQSTIQHFKKGEILRITVEGWYKCDEVSAQTAFIGLAHDPANRADINENPSVGGANSQLQIILDNQPTRLSINVPFVLDIT